MLLLCAIPAVGQTPAPPANDDCLACHADEGAARADGRSVAVAPPRWAESVHGSLGMTCVDCHTDLAGLSEFPHADTLSPVNCASCHEAAVSQYNASAHAHAPGGSPAVTCVSCHGMHDIRPSSDPTSRTNHFNVPATCGTCHGPGAPGRAAAHRVFASFADSIHGRALSGAGLKVAPNCVSCHGAHEIRETGDPASRVHRLNVVETCARCHEGIKPAYESGIHALAVKSGNALAPVCNDCHTAHEIRDVGTERWQLGVISECGTCHDQSLRTYRDTFHGQVTALGFTRVAKCSDCHGSHGILPASNPQSMVSPARRLETCRTCHPDANESFAGYDPHADPHDRARSPVLYYTYLFMQALLAGVFLFFGAHTLLWFPRSWQARRARRIEPQGRQEPAHAPARREAPREGE